MSNADANKQIQGYQLGQNTVIESLWLTFTKNTHSRWTIKIKEALMLHQYLKEVQPKQILELGTGIGCATAIMAFTCPDARIYSVEQSQKCIDLAKTLIPERLQERIFFSHVKTGISHPIMAVNPFQYWSAYAQHDWIDYDFILVDGPGPFIANALDTTNNQQWKCLAEVPNGDVVFLLPKMKPGTIIYVNGRQEAAKLYLRHLQHYLEVIEAGVSRSIFRRNKEPLQTDFSDFKNSDTSWGALQEGGYFEKYVPIVSLTELEKNEKNS